MQKNGRQRSRSGSNEKKVRIRNTAFRYRLNYETVIKDGGSVSSVSVRRRFGQASCRFPKTIKHPTSQNSPLFCATKTRFKCHFHGSCIPSLPARKAPPPLFIFQLFGQCNFKVCTVQNSCLNFLFSMNLL
jgi:hypothetical protein